MARRSCEGTLLLRSDRILPCARAWPGFAVERRSSSTMHSALQLCRLLRDGRAACSSTSARLSEASRPRPIGLARRCGTRASRASSAGGGTSSGRPQQTYTRESRLKSIASRIQPRPGLPAGSRPPRAAHRPAAARKRRRDAGLHPRPGRRHGPLLRGRTPAGGPLRETGHFKAVLPRTNPCRT